MGKGGHPGHHERGDYTTREEPLYRREGRGRDWKHRGFTVGIGGPVGSGKTALMLVSKRMK